MQLTIQTAQMELSHLTPCLTDSYLQEAERPHHLEGDSFLVAREGERKTSVAPLWSGESAETLPVQTNMTFFWMSSGVDIIHVKALGLRY